MKFNFPKYEESVLVQIKVSKELFNKLKEIGDTEQVLRHDAIVTLLEGAVSDYFSTTELTITKQVDKWIERDKAAVITGSIGVSPLNALNGYQVVKPWSEKYTACIICKSTDRKHMGRGKCTRCYFKKDNKSYSEPKIKKDELKILPSHKQTLEKDEAYCQNADCPWKHSIFLRDAMIPREDMVFCSEKCADEVLPE